MADFESVQEILEAGNRYWVVGPYVDGKPLWETYRPVLQLRNGKDAFRVVETWENPKQKSSWAVLEVKKDLLFDGSGVFKFGEHSKGDNPQSLGLWEVPREHWISTASDALDKGKDYFAGLERMAWAVGFAGLAVWLVTRSRARE